jgi:hypothetical protein
MSHGLVTKSCQKPHIVNKFPLGPCSMLSVHSSPGVFLFAQKAYALAAMELRSSVVGRLNSSDQEFQL